MKLSCRGLRAPLFWVMLACAAWPALAQGPAQQAMPLSNRSLELQVLKKRTWTVAGRVIGLSGRPLGGAKVRLQVSARGEQPRVLDTNLQGQFSTNYTFDVKEVTSLDVDVTASKDGYAEGHEGFHIRPDTSTREIVLALAEDEKESGLLPLQGLISALAPRLGSAAAIQQVPGSVRKPYQQAAEAFWGQGQSGHALTLFKKAAAQEPTCLNCGLALSVAYFAQGSWMSADQELTRMKELAASGQKPSPEYFFILGVYDTWLHQEKQAAGYFVNGLKDWPSDPGLLTELGRTQLLLQNWQAAEEVLEKAVKAGAPPDARLLRARALLEEGDPDEAAREMQAYLGTRQPRDLPEAPRRVYLQLKERLELKSYGKVKSLLTESPDQLAKSFPDLKGLEPATSQDELKPLLAQVGEQVETFFRTFPSTVSTEDIHQESLSRDGGVKDSLEEKANYLLLAQQEKWGLGLSEYRTYGAGLGDRKPATRPGLLRTSGFASTSLVFHPKYQAGSTFRYLGTQMLDGRPTKVLAYAQDPGRAQMIGRFDANGVSSPLLTQGVAWVDGESGAILRMRTELLKPLPRVRLSRETTEIQFAQVSFKDFPSPFWLPREVAVTVEWRGRTFRNVHRYSDFKLFNVEAKEKRDQTLPTEPLKPR